MSLLDEQAAPAEHAGMVNVPVYRGSTILSETLEEWESKKGRNNPLASYGRFGSPLTRSLEAAICELEGGYRSILFPSGLSACTHALLGLNTALTFRCKLQRNTSSVIPTRCWASQPPTSVPGRRCNQARITLVKLRDRTTSFSP